MTKEKLYFLLIIFASFLSVTLLPNSLFASMCTEDGKYIEGSAPALFDNNKFREEYEYKYKKK